MKTKKSAALAMLSTFTALMLFSPLTLAASPTPLNLQMGGLIVNAGTQHYELSGGHLVTGVVFGAPVATSAQLHFDIEAKVSGLTTSGEGSLSLVSTGSQSGQGDGHGVAKADNGNHQSNTILSGEIKITDEIPAAVFPLNQDLTNCDPTSQSCTSQIPLLFVGALMVDGQGQGAQPIPIAIESAYWDPFGAPIVISSLDSQTSPSIFLIATYTKATIDWKGVQLQGQLAGTYGSEGVTGFYSTVSNSQENLVAGTERDSGQIAFVGMSDPTLNMAGSFQGSTTFSLAGSFDCANPSAPLYFPGLPPGTCTATGATSIGKFQMQSGHLTVAGSFNTLWSVPSLITTTVVTASVIQH